MPKPNDILTARYHEASENKILEINAALATVSDEFLPKLPEHLFKRVFLDFFAGEQNPVHHKETMQNWLSIAGNPFHEVGIIDDNNHSKVLFRVPPLFDRSVVKSFVQDRTSLGHILRSAEQYSQISPIAGRNYLLENINQFDLMSGEAEHRSQYLSRWNAILERYGKPKLKDGPAVKAEAEPKGVDDGDEDFYF